MVMLVTLLIYLKQVKCIKAETLIAFCLLFCPLLSFIPLRKEGTRYI